jgi:hypothetical protein
MAQEMQWPSPQMGKIENEPTSGTGDSFHPSSNPAAPCLFVVLMDV